MDLDERGARAADALRRRTTQDLDLAGARSAITGADQRRAQLRRARLGSTVVGLFAVLGLVAVVAVVANAPGDDRVTETGGGLDTNGAEKGYSAAQSRILNALPNSPIDGKASWRLPVVARPQSGLRDGDTITVYGRGFGPNESLGIVQCSSEADTSGAGVGACQLSNGPDDTYGAVTYATASDEGTVVAEFVVHRYITTPAGRVDCLSAAERCLVGMGAISNYDKSGGSYIGFEGQPAFEEPVLSIDPAGPYTPGQEVHARFTGLVPGRGIRVQQCLGERCHNLIDGTGAADGTADLAVVLQPSFIDDETGAEVACDGHCVLRGNGIGVKGQSSAPLPDPVPLAFTSETPSTPVTPAPSTTTTTVAPDVTGTSGPQFTPADPGPEVPDTEPESNEPPATATTTPGTGTTGTTEAPTTTDPPSGG